MANGRVPYRLAKAEAEGVEASQVFTHYDGALALMKLRQQDSPNTDMAIARVVRRQITRASILRGTLVPDWLAEGDKYGEEGPVLELDALLIRIGRLRADFVGRQAKTSQSRERSPMLEAANILEDALHEWSKSLPVDWKARLKADRLYPFELLDAETCEYRTHGHAAVMLRYRAVRILVNSIILQCLANEPGTGDLMRAVQDKIAELSHDICRDVPYFFNQAEPDGSRSLSIGKHIISSRDDISPKLAGLLAWPLAIAVNCDFVPTKQREWLRERLKSAAAAYGDCVLQQVAEGGVFSF